MKKYKHYVLLRNFLRWFRNQNCENEKQLDNWVKKSIQSNERRENERQQQQTLAAILISVSVWIVKQIDFNWAAVIVRTANFNKHFSLWERVRANEK